MTSDTTKSYSAQPVGEHSHHLFDNWFDPIESALRERAREFIEELILGEFDAALGRPRYGRRAKDADDAPGVSGHRHGSRTRTLMGTFGRTRSPCRGRGSRRPMARRRSGTAGRCARINAVRWRPMR